MAEKKRLDAYIVELGLCESREKAKTAIMAGDVYVNGQKALKAGDTVKETDQIEVRGGMEFVSRGGYKLKKAMAAFPIVLTGKICMDIGASTGGFTDCMLQNGAVKVYCVDVGYGQLAWKLRSDERVVNLERTNLRYVTGEQIPDPIDLAVMDVSFISIRLIIPALLPLLKPEADLICLIKPQFEAGREDVGKKGVVRDSEVHVRVVSEILAFAENIGLSVLGLDFSPIRGPEGNIEYICHLKNCAGLSRTMDVRSVVSASHKELES